jgi:hypothetical protein
VPLHVDETLVEPQDYWRLELANPLTFDHVLNILDALWENCRSMKIERDWLQSITRHDLVLIGRALRRGWLRGPCPELEVLKAELADAIIKALREPRPHWTPGRTKRFRNRAEDVLRQLQVQEYKVKPIRLRSPS